MVLHGPGGRRGDLDERLPRTSRERARPGAGYALAEANHIISARQRFGEGEALFKFIDAYRTTPQFSGGPLGAVHVHDDATLQAALSRAVVGQDTVAAMICRGILDLGAKQRTDLLRRLHDDGPNQ